ncbi:hypothetical protein BSL82_02335 [Tardibacter chloracetimidivorans]|uniref:Uncharacterized protein n=1 Tax=Tardibacter chloracetimidivorans TaxID=1921510 RepID=A0A1L3ZRN8_9SPHN|nr:ABC transporter ATP-binding protein/permease [Tardibacter chloracetimidivorans]API58285.1 hypothetical protein BSL82_02335 [Tardibacter chloracetimidivorans]
MGNLLSAPLTVEPDTITAGDTVRIRRDDLSSLYPQGEGYALVYHFQRTGGAIDAVDATWDAEGWLITVAASGWEPGPRSWSAVVTHGSYGRRTIASGSLTVLPDPTVVDASFDPRSHARKVLDAIEAVIERRASKTHEETTLSDGRQVKSIPHAELMRLRGHYAALVAAEQRQSDQRRGLRRGLRRGGGTLKARF